MLLVMWLARCLISVTRPFEVSMREVVRDTKWMSAHQSLLTIMNGWIRPAKRMSSTRNTRDDIIGRQRQFQAAFQIQTLLKTICRARNLTKTKLSRPQHRVRV